MYKVYVKTLAGDQYPLHLPSIDEVQLIDPMLGLELNGAGSFDFEIPKQHPHRDKIKKMETEIQVYDDGQLLFNGRPISVETDFYDTAKYECEGELNYFLDTIHDPFAYQGDVRGLFTQVINNHNKLTEAKKQFKIGKLEVPNTYLNRSSGYHLNSLEILKSRLVKTNDGYLRIRHDKDIRYLDCVADYGHVNTQVIRFDANLLDLSKHIDANELCSVVIPLGAEQEEEEGINDVKPRLTIESVNGGKTYLKDEEAYKKYGWICKTVYFDDVTLPENLKKKGQAYLDESKVMGLTIELSAIDLNMIDVNTEKIHLGDWIRVVSKPHDLDKLFLVGQMSINLTNPEANTITLGKKLDTSSGKVSQGQKDLSDKVNEIANSTNQKVNEGMEHLTDQITGGSGGYVRIKMSDDKPKRPEELLIMDKPNIEDAKNLWRWNKNGLGASNTGYDGVYHTGLTTDGWIVGQRIRAGSIDAEKLSAQYRGELDTRFEVTEKGILAEVKRVKNDLSASIAVVEGEVKTKVTQGEVESTIEQKADSIRLKANRISWNSDYSSMSEWGQLSCQSAKLAGRFDCKGTAKYITMQDGVMYGGANNKQYGYIDYSGYSVDTDTRAPHYGIQIQGGILRINTAELAVERTENTAHAWLTKTGQFNFSGGHGIKVENGLVTAAW